jgi:hypothetical protein
MDSNNIDTGLDAAIILAQNNDLDGARIALGISDKITNDQLVEGLIAINNGIELIAQQKTAEASIQFNIAQPLIELCNDEEAKIAITILNQMALAQTELFSGNAHKATELLNINSVFIEKVSFFMPEFKILAYSIKAGSLVALARSFLNGSDIASAEKAFGELRRVHDELLSQLDPDSIDHNLSYVEVYGTRLELAFLFISSFDLPSLDLKSWKHRLLLTKKDSELLQEKSKEIPNGPIKILADQYPIIYSVLDILHISLDISLNQKRPFRKEEAQDLVSVGETLFSVKQELEKSGERGRGILYMISVIDKLHQNLLEIGKVVSKDFGKFSGVITLISFVLLIFLLHLTIKPSGYYGLLYYLGSLTVALIVGFGYGALKFQPLIKIFSKGIEMSKSEEPSN